MKRYMVWMIALFVSATTLVASPSDADAAFRIGADVKWLPLSSETAEIDGQALDADRALDTLGVGLRFMLGLDIFSLGAKANFTAHSFEDDDLNFSELNVNAIARIGIPVTNLAVFAEVGPSLSLNYGGIGYNAVLGVEYDLLGLPLLDLNLGVAGQYSIVPVGAGAGQSRDFESMRLFVFIGVDLGI